ncbi:hypothetical protein N1851_007868 [Merluccius polli]|uniref:Uncharacterized protein n=1 Tax=Merluccius polli TaxID=89951 RepID=A0AA47P7G5_MERPO|nr:hypothetical protein N1851_007868 [Merluccius polli]
MVLSKLDYCNSALIGLPACSIKPLQMIQNAAAHIIFLEPNHIPPLDLCVPQISVFCAEPTSPPGLNLDCSRSYCLNGGMRCQTPFALPPVWTVLKNICSPSTFLSLPALSLSKLI